MAASSRLSVNTDISVIFDDVVVHRNIMFAIKKVATINAVQCIRNAVFV